jgi:hypothetical protein
MQKKVIKMPTTLSPDTYPQLMNLINLTYRDKVETITAAQINDDNNIVAVALDGRKKLAVKITDNDIAIKLMGESAAFAKAAPKVLKKKTCKEENISCGFTCISGKKVCKIGMTIEQQRAYKELKSKVKIKNSGGELVAPAGKLATVPKPEEQPEPKPIKGVNNTIDEKYASDNPSDADVENWVRERIEARTNPTPENIAQRVADKIAGFVGQGNPLGSSFKSRSVDRDSFAKAMRASDDLAMKLYPNGPMHDLTGRVYPGYKGTIEEIEQNWRDTFSPNSSPYYLKEKDLAAVNKTIASPKASEKTKKAAIAKLARHNQAIDDSEKQMLRVPELAQRTFNRYQGTPEQRLQVHLDRFDQEIEGVRQDMAKEQNLLKTKKGAQKVAESIPTSRDEDGNKRTPKDHLKFVAENPSTAGDTRTKAQVKADYRRDAAKFHPDNQETGNAEKFRKIQQAYERKMQEFE